MYTGGPYTWRQIKPCGVVALFPPRGQTLGLRAAIRLMIDWGSRARGGRDPVGWKRFGVKRGSGSKPTSARSYSRSGHPQARDLPEPGDCSCAGCVLKGRGRISEIRWRLRYHPSSFAHDYLPLLAHIREYHSNNHGHFPAKKDG